MLVLSYMFACIFSSFVANIRFVIGAFLVGLLWLLYGTLQTDRATRCVSRNVANCCTNVAVGTYPWLMEVVELERYGRWTCSKLCPSSHDVLSVESPQFWLHP